MGFLGDGLEIMLIGMGVVFGSLLILSYVMVILGKFFGPKDKPLEKETKEGAGTGVATARVETVTDKGIESGENLDIPGEVVVVITASAATYLGTSVENVRIRVVRRQAPSSVSSWSMAGRQEIMGQRQMV